MTAIKPNGSPPFVAAVQANPNVPVLALRREAAAQALGVSEETFDRYIRPELPCVSALCASTRCH